MRNKRHTFVFKRQYANIFFYTFHAIYETANAFKACLRLLSGLSVFIITCSLVARISGRRYSCHFRHIFHFKMT